MARGPAIARTISALDRAIRKFRAADQSVALVPTMGALHAGHVALIERARRKADRVMVSIFVNPAQFAPHEDFASYPRPFDADIAVLRKLAVDLVWAPTPDVMYPPGFATRVVGQRSGRGRSRGPLPPAFLRRRRHRGGEALHPVPAGLRDVRREGLPAAPDRHPHGGRSRPAGQGRRRADGARGRRPRDVLAQRLSRRQRARHRADALSRAARLRRTHRRG